MAVFSALGKYKNFGLLIIRAGLGIMFIYHGLPKLLGGVSTWRHLGESTKYVGIHFWPVVWGLMSAIVEAAGGLLLIMGYQFRVVCLLLFINLLVAALSHLGNGESLGEAAHAIEDAITFAGLFFLGAGRYSVDKK